MHEVLYGTVWFSLALFAAGEWGKSRMRPWAWPVSAAGAVFIVIHIVIAMQLVDWNYETAARATALKTEAVYGLRWGGGVVANFVFAAVWLAELSVWRWSPSRYASTPAVVIWLARLFYLTMIANAAIVFAAPGRRVVGAVMVAIILVSWWPGRPPLARRL